MREAVFETGAALRALKGAGSSRDWEFFFSETLAGKLNAAHERRSFDDIDPDSGTSCNVGIKAVGVQEIHPVFQVRPDGNHSLPKLDILPSNNRRDDDFVIIPTGTDSGSELEVEV